MHRVPSCVVLSFLLFAGVDSYGKGNHSKKPSTPPQDQIEVVGHLPSNAGPISRFVETQHYRRDYLYAENESGKTVTLLDITSAKQPALLADMTLPQGAAGSLVAATGDSVLVSSEAPAAQASLPPQTFRIMNFADPLHPTVKQEFAGVTAMARDEKRGLIFLANAAGIWILQQHYAADPQAEKEWEHMMLDAR